MLSRLLSVVPKTLAPAALLPSFARQPVVTGVRSVPANLFVTEEAPAMELLNRNARRPKKANHGKRPCSHHRRRQKRLGAKKA